MKEYIPNPMDTGHIQLPKELEYLVEEMAKNVHEVWSKTRIEQGWTYGNLHPQQKGVCFYSLLFRYLYV